MVEYSSFHGMSGSKSKNSSSVGYELFTYTNFYQRQSGRQPIHSIPAIHSSIFLPHFSIDNDIL